MTPTRDRILAAMGSLVAQREWAAVSLSDVAAEAGVSRQTVYNEFGTRSTLAELYVEALLDRLVQQHVPGGSAADVAVVVQSSLESWFGSLGEDEAFPSLLGVVSNETEFVEAAAARLAMRYCEVFEGLDPAKATMFARLVVRVCLGYLMVPPATDEDPVPALVAALGPYAQHLLAVDDLDPRPALGLA
jgi:AcrR family transcriptional regulator